jgi:hypothetical protein
MVIKNGGLKERKIFNPMYSKQRIARERKWCELNEGLDAGDYAGLLEEALDEIEELQDNKENKSVGRFAFKDVFGSDIEEDTGTASHRSGIYIITAKEMIEFFGLPKDTVITNVFFKENTDEIAFSLKSLKYSRGANLFELAPCGEKAQTRLHIEQLIASYNERNK